MRGLLQASIFAAASAAVYFACSREPAASSGGGIVLAAPAQSPEVFSQVADFALVDSTGKAVALEDLRGRPWVASFLFTRCSGPCPKVAGTLKTLQGRLPTGTPIVTFSVDPSFDTPEVLREYARKLGADPERWIFLTGEEKAIHDLIRRSFLSAVETAPPGEAPIGLHVSHRTQLVAVDERGGVRGFYHGESEDQIELLLARLAFLQQESE